MKTSRFMLNSHYRTLLAVASGLLVAFIIVALGTRSELTLPADVAVLEAIHTAASPLLDVLMSAVTQTGGIMIVSAISALIIAWLWQQRRYTLGMRAVVTVGGSAMATFVTKLVFERARPELWSRLVGEDSFSFPSGHATASMALALVIVMLSWNTRWRVPAVIIAASYVIAVAVTRLYLGVHYPTDIFGGWIMASFWFVIALMIPRRLAEPRVK